MRTLRRAQTPVRLIVLNLQCVHCVVVQLYLKFLPLQLAVKLFQNLIQELGSRTARFYVILATLTALKSTVRL